MVDEIGLPGLEENELQVVTSDVEKKTFMSVWVISLEKFSGEYFPEKLHDMDWIGYTGSISKSYKTIDANCVRMMSIWSTQVSSFLKQKFESDDSNLNDIWIGLKDEYPAIVE